MQTLTDRQQKILERLESNQSLSIEEIERDFGVSIATAYRDIQVLVKTGLALKTTGGVKLAKPIGLPKPVEDCFFCGGTVQNRSAFVIQMEDGNQNRACCPHCGLLALKRPGAQSAFSNDFLYGKLVNARQAFFVFGSRISLCCEPSVLCFATEEDAYSFQLGYGGEILDLPQALARMQESIHLS
jgi:hypothetical protein